MAAKKEVRLKAVMANQDGRSVWTGAYECSVCGLRFHPDWNDKAKLLADFDAHKRVEHGP